MDITVFPGQVLDILVQNQGRGTFYPASDFKGIIGNVTLGNKVLTKWTMFPLTLPEYPSRDPKPFRFPWLKNIVDPEVPAIYSGSFFVDKPLDTYINTDGWRNVRISQRPQTSQSTSRYFLRHSAVWLIRFIFRWKYLFLIFMDP